MSNKAANKTSARKPGTPRETGNNKDRPRAKPSNRGSNTNARGPAPPRGQPKVPRERAPPTLPPRPPVLIREPGEEGVELRMSGADAHLFLDESKWALSDGVEFPAVQLKRRKGDHPLLASCRAVQETIMVRQAVLTGKPLVDVGGNAVRHYYNNPDIFPAMRFVIPDNQSGDGERYRQALELAGADRVSRENLTLENYRQLLSGAIPICCHSDYYLSDALVRAVVDYCGEMWCVQHVFEQPEGELIVEIPKTANHPAAQRVEATWVTKGRNIVMRAKSNAQDYSHPNHARVGIDVAVYATFTHDGHIWSRVVRYRRGADPKADLGDAIRETSDAIASTPIGAQTLGRATYHASRGFKNYKVREEDVPEFVTGSVNLASFKLYHVNLALIRATASWWTRLRAELLHWWPGEYGWKSKRLASLLEDDDRPSASWWRSVYDSARENALVVSLAATAVLIGFAVQHRASVAGAGLNAYAAIFRGRSEVSVGPASFGVPALAWRGVRNSLCVPDEPDGFCEYEHCPEPGALTENVRIIGDRTCDKADNFGHQPCGLGMPVNMHVIHDCPRTGLKAVRDRVLKPYPGPRPRPQDWVSIETLLVTPDVTGWLSQYTGEKLERKKQGFLGPIKNRRKGLVKRELTGKTTNPDPVDARNGLVAETTNATPRWITACDETVSDLWGPYAVPFSKATREHHAYPRAEDRAHVYYAVGFNHLELGAIRTEMEEHVPNAVALATDAERYDSRIQDWQNEDQVRQMGITDPRIARALEADANVTELRTAYLFSTWEARRRSGDDVTTVFNTRVQMEFWHTVFDRAWRAYETAYYLGRLPTKSARHPALIRMRYMCGGDDGYGLVSYDIAEIVRRVTHELAAEIGWVMEFEEGQQEDLGFFSSLFVPLTTPVATDYGVTRYQLLPRPGRAWAKATACTKAYGPTKLNDWRHSNAYSRRALWGAAPILRTLNAAFLKVGRFNEKYVQYTFAAPTEATDVYWPFWERRYGMSQAAIEIFEAMIAHIATQDMVVLNDTPLMRALVGESGFEWDSTVRVDRGVQVHCPGGLMPVKYTRPSQTTMQVGMAFVTLTEELSCILAGHALAYFFGPVGYFIPSWVVGAMEVPRLVPRYGLLGAIAERAVVHTGIGAARARTGWLSLLVHLTHNVARVWWETSGTACLFVPQQMTLSKTEKKTVQAQKKTATTQRRTAQIQRTTQREIVRTAAALALAPPPSPPPSTRVGALAPPPSMMSAPRTPNSRSVRIGHPDEPHEACNQLCREDPWNCETHCEQMGMSMANCRNPTNAKRSETLHHDIPFRVTTDSNGAASVRFQPFIHRMVELYCAGTGGSLTGFFSDSTASLGPVYTNQTGSHPAFPLYGSMYSAHRYISMGLTLWPDMATMNDQGTIDAGVMLANSFATDSGTLESMPGSGIFPAKDGVSVAMPAQGSEVEVYLPVTNADGTGTGAQQVWITKETEYSPDDWFNVGYDPQTVEGWSGPWTGTGGGVIHTWDCSDRLILNIANCAAGAAFDGLLTVNIDAAPISRYVDADLVSEPIGAHGGQVAVQLAQVVGASNFAKNVSENPVGRYVYDFLGHMTPERGSDVVKRSMDVALRAAKGFGKLADDAIVRVGKVLGSMGLDALAAYL